MNRVIGIRSGIMAALLVGTTIPALADNGEVAYAWPIPKITVDGDLSDWDASLPRFAIERPRGAEVPLANDFQASFRAGYNPQDGAVYLALEIADDTHFVDNFNCRDWECQDSHSVYIDPEHNPRGSGSLVYTALGRHRYLIGRDRSWDPKVETASWQQAEVEVARHGQVTVYEWRIDIGEQAKAGRSIGLDHLICDCDSKEEETHGGLLIQWGPYNAKSRGASRCGDLVLLPSATEVGRLSGRLEWGDKTPFPCPRRVRITSTDNADLWVHTQADEDGRFQIDLPEGNYRISCPFKTVGDDWGTLLRVDPDISVRAQVAKRSDTTATLLQLRTLPMPDLLQDTGVLLDYDPSREAEVDAFIEQAMEYFQTPGASIALVQDEDVVYHKTFGYKNFFTGERVDESTLFEACSITKIVFAFAVNRLAERGLIDLDHPLCQYLPFEEIEHDDRYRKITARHCLTHQTGFPNWASGDGIEIEFYPGTAFGYSGEGFEYLGRVVTHLVNQDQKKRSPHARPLSLEDIVRREALIPMEFEENVHFSDNEELLKVVAHGHYTTRATAAFIPEQIGVAHSMHTEARSMANFMINLLRGEGMSPEGYEAMFEPQVKVDLDDDYQGPKWPRYYGLGFHLMDTPYGWSFGHGGSNGDFKCRFEALRDEAVGFLVFTNGDSGYQLFEEFRKFLFVGREGAADESSQG